MVENRRSPFSNSMYEKELKQTSEIILDVFHCPFPKSPVAVQLSLSLFTLDTKLSAMF